MARKKKYEPMSLAEYHALMLTMKSEDEFQADIIAAAESLGWLVFHDRDSRLNNSGLPDLIMVKGKRLIFAELKREKRYVFRPMQVIWLNALRLVPGIEIYEWHPRHAREVLDILIKKPVA